MVEELVFDYLGGLRLLQVALGLEPSEVSGLDRVFLRAYLFQILLLLPQSKLQGNCRVLDHRRGPLSQVVAPVLQKELVPLGF